MLKYQYESVYCIKMIKMSCNLSNINKPENTLKIERLQFNILIIILFL
jgi:hypothetical protein